jgi:hypothetical protein
MPATVYEAWGSRPWTVGGTGLESTYELIIKDAADEPTAHAAALAAAPTDYFGIPRGSVKGTRLAPGLFHVTIEYSPAVRSDAAPTTGQNPGGAGDLPGSQSPTAAVPREFSISTGGGTQHITRSKTTVNSYGATGSPPPNYFRLIGVSKDGVEGVDILAPDAQLKFTTKVSQLSFGYFKHIVKNTNKVNENAWRGFAERELLFAGVEANYRDGDAWNITFSFRYSPTNEEAIPIRTVPAGLEITVPAGEKAGWDYLWVAYEDVSSEVTGVYQIVPRPKAAYVERVYDVFDFTTLGIG